MTCREVKHLLEFEGRKGVPAVDQQDLRVHLEACGPCSQAVKVVRLSSILLGALREEITPEPSFYSRLREQLAAARAGQAHTTPPRVLGFAQRLVPSLALGVLLLAGVTIYMGGPDSSLPTRMEGGRDVTAFSLDGLNLPKAVDRPTQDQMLAFVLTQDNE